MDQSGDTTEKLLDRAGQGEHQAVAELFERHRDRLALMVRLRMDRRLQGRLDPADILQESFLECCRSINRYLQTRSVPFFLWLRTVTSRKLISLHRRHLGAKVRDAKREISLYDGYFPEATSECLAARLLGHDTTPSHAAARAELQVRLEEMLNAMEAIDREVLALRHFEELTNSETAQVLRIKENTASNRYIRALERLRKLMPADSEMGGW